MTRFWPRLFSFVEQDEGPARARSDVFDLGSVIEGTAIERDLRHNGADSAPERRTELAPPAIGDPRAAARLILEAHRRATSPTRAADVPLPPKGSQARFIVDVAKKVGAA